MVSQIIYPSDPARYMAARYLALSSITSSSITSTAVRSATASSATSTTSTSAPGLIKARGWWNVTVHLFLWGACSLLTIWALGAVVTATTTTTASSATSTISVSISTFRGTVSVDQGAVDEVRGTSASAVTSTTST